MLRSLVRAAFGMALIAVLFTSCHSARSSSAPVSKVELMALVAGRAWPPSVVREIGLRGLGFQADDAYRSQLVDAGADASVLEALKNAKVASPPEAESESQKKVLLHMNAAARLMKGKNYNEAAAELNDALSVGFARAECGFVMGQILVEMENWPEAAKVYGEVLREDPDFPEAHTKAAFPLYRLEDEEDSLSEAKMAISRYPENAEAHKVAGLALEAMGKFDAAEHEYAEALRIQPDYVFAHYDLGILFHDKGDRAGAIA